MNLVAQEEAIEGRDDPCYQDLGLIVVHSAFSLLSNDRVRSGNVAWPSSVGIALQKQTSSPNLNVKEVAVSTIVLSRILPTYQ